MFDEDNPIKLYPQVKKGEYYTLSVVDEETGVNYVVVSSERYGGARSIAICPRYNADGTLYVGKEKS